MKVIVAAAGAIAWALAGSLQAANGLLIVEKTTGIGTTPATNQIQIESNRIRVENSGPRGEKQVVIFDGTRQVLLMIDDDRKSFAEVSKDDLERLSKQVSDLMAQIEQQLAGLPPERRAQVEAMMKDGRGGIGPASRVTYRKAGKGEAGKWSCERYEGFEGDKKVAELCTVEPQALGFTAADLAMTQQLFQFMKKLLPQMSGQVFTTGSSETGFEGVPVRRTFTLGGREVTTEIVDVSRQSFADASYAPPAGYRKTVFGSGGRGR